MGWVLPTRAAQILGRSHGVAARVLGSVNGSQFVLPTKLRPGGSIAIDGKSPARRQLSCELVAAIDDPVVNPTVAELRAEYAVVDPASGTQFWIPVGTFVITDTSESSPGVVSVKGIDRWQRVVDARFEQPRTTSGSTVTAITNLLTEADSRISVVASGALTGTHQASLWDRDRDDAVLKLARSIGARVWFDAQGVAHIDPIALLSDPIYWQVGSGTGGVKASSARGTTRSRTYNCIVVIGDPGGGAAPVYGVARDTDPVSPTRWGGPFGKRTRFYSTSLISSSAQANAMAAGLLARNLGVATSLELNTPPNPGLDADDVLLAEVAPGVWQRQIVESFTLPLGLGTTPIATRSSAGDDNGE